MFIEQRERYLHGGVGPPPAFHDKREITTGDARPATMVSARESSRPVVRVPLSLRGESSNQAIGGQ